MEKTMSDNEEKQRPNAKYRLSKENVNEDEIVFHYNRERRLEKAPQSVRDLYNKQPPPKGGLIRPLINTRPKLIMFASIVLMCAAILLVSIFGNIGSSLNLEGNLLTVQAIRYEGAVIVAIKKSVQKDFRSRFTVPYTGAVNIAVADEDTHPEDVFYHRIFFTAEPLESYRFAVPFDSNKLTFVIQSEKKTINVKIKPE
jgi:hypothetical protein